MVSLLLRRAGAEVDGRDLEGRTTLYALALKVTEHMMESGTTPSCSSSSVMVGGDSSGAGVGVAGGGDGKVPSHSSPMGGSDGGKASRTTGSGGVCGGGPNTGCSGGSGSRRSEGSSGGAGTRTEGSSGGGATRTEGSSVGSRCYDARSTPHSRRLLANENLMKCMEILVRQVCFVPLCVFISVISFIFSILYRELNKIVI